MISPGSTLFRGTRGGRTFLFNSRIAPRRPSTADSQPAERADGDTAPSALWGSSIPGLTPRSSRPKSAPNADKTKTTTTSDSYARHILTLPARSATANAAGRKKLERNCYETHQRGSGSFCNCIKSLSDGQPSLLGLTRSALLWYTDCY
jgi:hypothetical protein